MRALGNAGGICPSVVDNAGRGGFPGESEVTSRILVVRQNAADTHRAGLLLDHNIVGIVVVHSIGPVDEELCEELACDGL